MQQQPQQHHHIALSVWGLLVLLSVIWGGSYLFVGIAVKNLSPLVIVMLRVVLAALALLPFHWLTIGHLPRDRGTWVALLGLSIFNNVIPFSLIVTGQTMISSGLASVINATSPLFGVVIIAMAGLEPLIPRKIVGLFLGIAGVIIIKGGTLLGHGTQSVGILLCLGAAASYGLGSLWAKLKVKNLPPLSLATGQLLCSSVILTVLAFCFENPSQIFVASTESWIAILGLALLSTSFAYLIFFRVLARAGAANVLLVTMLIPVSAIGLGIALLGETLKVREIIGALVILAALAIIDGRVVKWLRPGKAPG